RLENGKCTEEFKTDGPEEQPNHQRPKNNKQLLDLHLELSNTIHPTLWVAAEQLSEFRAETDVTLTTSKQKQKFDRFLAEQKPKKEIQPLEPKKTKHWKASGENTNRYYKVQRYKQVEEAPMGSPLSPVIANLFMEDLKTPALQTASHKPKLWLRCVDDTFVFWTHGREQLNAFLDHLNSIHQKLKFTMEIEDNNQLPFLDVLVKKRRDGSLGHTVYRSIPHHHPAQLHSMVKTLVTRTKTSGPEEQRPRHIKNPDRTTPKWIFREKHQ
ncbi:hypothetical protein ILUMI_04485, partial [Ignelater luminosus]